MIESNNYPRSELQGMEQEVQEAEDMESLKKALEAEKEKAEGYLANWQRAQADFLNYKKRSEQERLEQASFANATLIANLLPILDDTERALGNVSTALVGLTWVDGIRLIYRKLQAVLQSQGLTEIEAEGKDFDPNLHQAVLYGEGQEEKIIEELQKGYTFHDRVIRPTMVKVGKGEGQAKPDEGEQK